MLKYISSLVTLIILILFANQLATAQMFSVSTDTPSRQLPTVSFILAGEPTSFEYRHADSEPEHSLAFNGPLYRIRGELPGLQIYLAYNNDTGGDNGMTVFNAGAMIEGQYMVYRRPSIFISIPLMLKTDYLQVTTRRSFAGSEDMQQSSAMVGAGLQIHNRISSKIRTQIKAIPQYGFSVTSFGGMGGSVSVLEGQARVYIDNVFRSFGVVAGYDYRRSVYDLEADQFNYRMETHSILLGITF